MREHNVFPHHDATFRLVHVDEKSPVEVLLNKVGIGCTRMLVEPIHGRGRVVETIGLEFIQADMEDVVREEVGHLRIDRQCGGPIRRYPTRILRRQQPFVDLEPA